MRRVMCHEFDPGWNRKATLGGFNTFLSDKKLMTKNSNGLKTILFVHGNNDLYGAEVVLLELLKRLDRNRFCPIVVLPTDTKHIHRLSACLDQEGIEYHFVRMGILRRKYFHPVGLVRFSIGFVFGIMSLVALIRQRRVALVHSNTIAVVCGAIAASITRTPHVWHLHEIIVDPVIVRRAMHFLACHLSQAVVTISGAVRSHVLKDCASHSDKIHVIHDGIDLERFATSGHGQELRRDSGIPSEALLVGMIGRVCRWKGQLLFLQAAKLVLGQRPGTYFLAVGGVFDDETFYMDQFREAVENSGLRQNFVISDFRVDIPEVLSALDIFVLPSTQPEPFGIVILEAMAAGKPVVAAAHGGPTEIVVNNQTGYLVPPKDPQALASAILKLAERPSLMAAMGAAGRHRAWEHFHVDRYVGDFEYLYTELLSGGAGFPGATNKPSRSDRVQTVLRD